MQKGINNADSVYDVFGFYLASPHITLNSFPFYSRKRPNHAI